MGEHKTWEKSNHIVVLIIVCESFNGIEIERQISILQMDQDTRYASALQHASISISAFLCYISKIYADAGLTFNHKSKPSII